MEVDGGNNMPAVEAHDCNCGAVTEWRRPEIMAFRQGSEDRLDEGIVFSTSISTTSDCRNPPSRLAVLGNKLGVLHAP